MEPTLRGLYRATRSYSGHLNTQNTWRKARDHYSPCSGHQIKGNNNRKEQLIPCRVVESHLSLPSLLFHRRSITTVCGATTASASRRESQALPHTNHPLGQLFWQIPTKGSAWAGHRGSALAGDSSGGEHAQAVGEESSPTCSRAEPPWLSDAIYPADICLPSSAGTLSPCARLPGDSSACGSWDFLHGPVLLPRGTCKISPCPLWG